MNISTLLLLGLIAGGTIYIGLPFGRLRNMSSSLRAALSMLAAGILLFLLIEIMGEAMGQTSAAIQNAAAGAGRSDSAALLVILLIGGFFIGLLSLVWIQQKWMTNREASTVNQLSYMIATGIGFHNLSEGLAIGQSAAQGKAGLAIGLVVGFALHNATEGFGIVGPSMNNGKQVPWKSILLLGLIGGGPTFVGTLLGSLWTSTAISVFVLAIAGGTLVYVLKELFSSVRRETAQNLIMSALVLGVGLGWSTEVVTNVAEAGKSAAAGAGVVREADGDVIPAAAQPAVKVADKTAQAQNALAADMLHEKALQPKILADGTKQYTLTASVFPWELYPGMAINAWGYNGQVPGPLLRVQVGDKVSIVLKNKLPQPTTLHLHGLAVPNDMDGVPTMSMSMNGMPDMKLGTQEAIQPDGSFTYTFTVTPQMLGTHFYHTHVNDDFQMDQGLHGVLIVDPQGQNKAHYDVDALYEMSSFKVKGSEAENVFTFNGKAFPDAPMLYVHRGDKVLIRLVNASAEESHVVHLHGYTFQIVARDGNPVAQPESANTVLLGPSQTADIEFTATNPGQWMLHCHIMDHAVNPDDGDGDGSADHMAGMGGLTTFVVVQ